MEPDFTLTLNAAEKHIQFLLACGPELLCAQEWSAPRGGAELLAPALQDACVRLGIPLSDIKKVAAVAGPGSFTGIRLALTTSAAMARAHKVRQAGLDYLQCLASSVLARPGERLSVIVNARRDWVYSGDYKVDANGIPRLQENIVLLPLPPEQMGIDIALWAAHGNGALPDYLLGSGVTSHRALFQAIYPAEVRFMPPSCDHPTTAALLALTLDADWGQTNSDIAPLYLRDCDAVDNLDDIARAQGQDPAHAHQTLERLLSTAL